VTDNDDAKVTSLVERLRARLQEQQAFDAHMDRLSAALRITVDAVTRMRREVPGITRDEIAGTFRVAAEEIESGGEWVD
jgi:hypothetical protein